MNKKEKLESENLEHEKHESAHEEHEEHESAHKEHEEHEHSSAELIEKAIAYLSEVKDELIVALEKEHAEDALHERVELTFEAIEHGLHQILEAKGHAKEHKEIKEEDLDEMAEVATAFDRSGDPLLQKQASVLDQILLTFGSKGAFAAFKAAQDKEVASLKEKYKDPYKFPKEAIDQTIGVEDHKKSIKNSIKIYRPQEASLSTRTCPDHPGAQIKRIGEDSYQCSYDNGIYNYTTGFTTLKGNKVPGSSVVNQSQSMNDINSNQMIFDTRESAANR